MTFDTRAAAPHLNVSDVPGDPIAHLAPSSAAHAGMTGGNHLANNAAVWLRTEVVAIEFRCGAPR